ncbi:MAG: SUMF1/EgtB/PvdO family nonheme iron enzyme [Devosia sp.]|nr:SUMF1/EgtB/PvdO family nonheme iron enzyme [Devosia sp.]
MSTLDHPIQIFAGLALPGVLLALGLAAVAVQVRPQLPWTSPAAAIIAPQTVTIPPGEVTYRAEGHFLRNGQVIDAPFVTERFAAPLTIMAYQVTAADYRLCVADGVCAPAEPQAIGQGNVPVTGVNFQDAEAYAGWLSDQTGQKWVLPSSAQWALAAGEDYPDDALGIEDDGSNPALRWLANYRQEAARKRSADPMPHTLGAFGTNEHGVADMGGNIWEWTQTCHQRVHLDTKGAMISQQPACTIRVLEGKHRAQISYFIRDAKSGGCTVGLPPDNLGFRLVREPAWHEQLLHRLGL